MHMYCTYTYGYVYICALHVYTCTYFVESFNEGIQVPSKRLILCSDRGKVKEIISIHVSFYQDLFSGASLTNTSPLPQ